MKTLLKELGARRLTTEEHQLVQEAVESICVAQEEARMWKQRERGENSQPVQPLHPWTLIGH